MSDEPEDTEIAADETMDEMRAWRDKLRQPPLPEAPAGGLAALAEAERERLAGASKDPMRLAELYAAHRAVAMDQYTLVRWSRNWWKYHLSHFRQLDEEILLSDIWRLLDCVDIETVEKDPDGAPTMNKVFKKLVVKRALVGEVRDALRAIVPSFDGDAPQWRYGRRFEETELGLVREPDPLHVVACGNGIFDLRQQKLRPPNPRLFITQGVSARWRESADCPEWKKFLASLWGNDVDMIRTLQEMFGYLMTSDTSQQKIFGLIGPSRSGKGTIARILKALLGESAVANPTLSSLSEPFGLEPLIGKTAAIVGDARLGGKSDAQTIAERLLSVSGEDPITVNCKNTKYVTVRLRARFLIVSNELPALQDASGALASRFILLPTEESYFGREDHGLEARLLAEMDGIFRWAVDGWISLHERGYFSQPSGGADLVEIFEDSGSPISAFIRDRCRLGAYEATVKDLYESWKSWCTASGRDMPGSIQAFAAKLKAAVPKMKKGRPRGADGKQQASYTGIGLAQVSDFSQREWR